MPAPLLTFLKYVVLVVLYLFFLRVLRAVWIELREPKAGVSGLPEQSGFEEAFAAAPPVAVRTGGPPASGQEPGDLTTLTPIVGGQHLVVTGPPGRSGVTYPLRGEVTVGRSLDCSVSLPDDTFVSQMHARVFRHDGQWWVEDLGSTNGTYVNDGRVDSPMVIRPGDRVQFGQTVMELGP